MNSLNIIGLDKCPNCGRVVPQDEIISLTSTIAMCSICEEDQLAIDMQRDAEAGTVRTVPPSLETVRGVISYMNQLSCRGSRTGTHSMTS